MKFGKLQKKTTIRNRFLIIYFIAGSVLLLVFFVIYTNRLHRKIRKDVQIVPDLYSKFLGLPTDVNLEHFLFQYFMEDIIPEIDYPIILTDSLKKPFSWENIDIPKKNYSELDEKQQELLIKMTRKMDRQHTVIPLKFSKEDKKIYSYVYYGDSKTMKQLKMMPYVEMILILIFVLLGIYGVISSKRGERNLLWVGLAKETAHQFGTPLSSLSGWLNILSMKIEEEGNNPEMLTMLDYMNVDIDRLNKIASRFGKIGSTLKRQPFNLHNIILDTIEHFKRRLPSISNKINIKFVSKIEEKEIMIDPDLIKWTLENLIKNSIDAMQKKGGNIIVKAFSENGKTHIQIQDKGTGLPKSMYKKIFYPGITSKERGWGLGLSLAKRIIEEYHNGKIHVMKSVLKKGTTFEIILPEE